jgi:hypothetical protein
MPLEGGFGDEAGLWLPAGTIIHIGVGTHEDTIQAECLLKLRVHKIQFAPGLGTQRQSGLVGRGEQQVPGGFQLPQRFFRLGIKLKFTQACGLDLPLVYHPRKIQNPISLEEYR